MSSQLKPTEVLNNFPFSDIDPQEFQRGYEHGLVSNTLTEFRKSFRLGFRKAKIELREQNNVRSFRSSVKIKSV